MLKFIHFYHYKDSSDKNWWRKWQIVINAIFIVAISVCFEQVLAGHGVSEDDYHLAIGIMWVSEDSNRQYQAANHNYEAYKMIIDILKRDVAPPLEAHYDNSQFIYINPMTLKKHMEEKDANG